MGKTPDDKLTFKMFVMAGSKIFKHSRKRFVGTGFNC